MFTGVCIQFGAAIVEAKEFSITLMNKNISEAVVRGIVLIIIAHLLSMRVE